MKKLATSAIALTLSLLLVALPARAVTVPAGTVIYGELAQEVTSKKKHFSEGDIVEVRVWRDVIVDGQVVVRAGLPMLAEISKLKKAKFAGIKGRLEISAKSVRGVDGTPMLLEGGYDKSGKGRMGMSIALAALVAWPLVFIKGKQARLEGGVVFDAVTQWDAEVETDSKAFALKLATPETLSVEILYDEMDPNAKQMMLPMTVTSCHQMDETPAIVTVNDLDIEPLQLSLNSEFMATDGECITGKAVVALSDLAQHFRKGINRFEVGCQHHKTELILEVEL